MNKFVQDQLSKCKDADLSNYNESENSFFIPKKTSIRLLEDSCYIIKLNDTIFSNEVLKSNWNNNTVPPHRYLKVDISKIMANMIKVNSIAYDVDTNKDLNKVWSGWLPSDQINVIEKL